MSDRVRWGLGAVAPDKAVEWIHATSQFLRHERTPGAPERIKAGSAWNDWDEWERQGDGTWRVVNVGRNSGGGIAITMEY